jgi:YfiR/HmsC-like
MGAKQEPRRGLRGAGGRKLTRLAVALCLAFGFPSVAYGQNSSEEYRLKAMYLGRIPNFVEWPPSAAAAHKAFQMCTVGYYPFGTRLASEVESVTVGGRKIELHMLGRGQELGGCEMVFFDSSEEKYYRKALETLKGKSVLTVGESERFLEAGGMVALNFENDKLQMEVNLGAARKANLKLDARLLAMAKRVITEQGTSGG